MLAILPGIPRAVWSGALSALSGGRCLRRGGTAPRDGLLRASVGAGRPAGGSAGAVYSRVGGVLCVYLTGRNWTGRLSGAH